MKLKESNHKLPGLEIKFTHPLAELKEFLDELAKVGSISIVTIDDQEYLVYVEKTEKM